VLAAANHYIFRLSHPEEFKDEQNIVRIGVILPLSGNSAFVGGPAQKAVETALRDIKSEQILKKHYELIFADNDNSQKNSILAANRLISINRVNAILTMWSPAGISINPITEQSKIPHIGCAWGYDVGQGYYNMNHATFPEEQVAALIKELLEREIKTIGFVWDYEKSQQELIDYLQVQLDKNDIKVVFNTPIISGTTDFRTEIAKMKTQNADIILMFMLPPGMDMFVKQKNEAGYDVPITSIEYLSYNPTLFEGMWYIGDAVGSREFSRYWKEETGNEISSCVANLYDSLKMLVEAFEEVDNPEDVVNYIMNNKDFESVMGEIYLDPDGNIHTQTVLKRIINGKSVEIE
jgi:ABC-type branched-subunit amino acid transport system substrate-binding protein